MIKVRKAESEILTPRREGFKIIKRKQGTLKFSFRLRALALMMIFRKVRPVKTY